MRICAVEQKNKSGSRKNFPAKQAGRQRQRRTRRRNHRGGCPLSGPYRAFPLLVWVNPTVVIH